MGNFNKKLYNLIQIDEKFKIDNDDFQLLWFEDFSGDTLNKNIWEYELGSIRGIEQQHYVNNLENVFIRKNPDGRGELVLKATDRNKITQYINPRSKNTGDERLVVYNSGSIRTHGKKEFLYGRIEMRAKLPKGKGVFPAFWTLGSDFILDGHINKAQGFNWARCGEIDIMELIGGEEGNIKNKEVYQTIHLMGNSNPDTYKKLAGTKYTISEDFYDDYHIFGINWNENEMQWYIDNQIVKTVNYSDDIISQKALNRPQYIQLNLAMGGIWPGEVSYNLGNKSESEYVIDYVLYAQNSKQKLDAQNYYKNAPKIKNAKDLILSKGEFDILSHIEVDGDYELDFSITDAPQFLQKELNATEKNPITEVELLHNGKIDGLEKIADLPPGEYSLYYTAFPKDVELDEKGFLNGDYHYKFDRKGVNLTIKG